MNLQTALYDIYKKKNELVAKDVVNEARPKEHYLHPKFEWDDSIAGEEYRIAQARRLIELVKINPVSKDEHSVRQYHSIVFQGRRAYKDMEEIQRDPVMSELVLLQAKRELDSLIFKYKNLEGFLEFAGKKLQDA